MTQAEMALAFAFLGGVIVAVGLGSLTYWLAQQLGAFRERSRDAAEQRGYAISRIESVGATAARATLAAESARFTLDRMRRESADAEILQAVADRHARMMRLRAARARGTRIS